MPKKWNTGERKIYYDSLHHLYITKNKTIKEIGKLFDLSEKTIYKRLKILKIKTNPYKKDSYCNQRLNISIPNRKSDILAEFFGIMLGDGKLSPNQILVTLGNKENDYVLYVKNKMETIFKTGVNVSTRKMGYKDVYISSVKLSKWLKDEGLVYNKVKSQVDTPSWIFSKNSYCESFIRGFFDTDGSVYKLKNGIQISLTNRSIPLLKSLQNMLIKLEYNVSNISCYKIYITREKDINRFFKEIKPANTKHIGRYNFFKKERVGTQVVNEGRL